MSLLGGLLLLLSACSGRSASVAGPGSSGDGEPPVRTDAAVYLLEESADRFDAEAIATYTNRTGGSVYFRRCEAESTGPMYDVRRVGPDADRRSLVGAAWACVGGVPTGVVPPGDTLTTRVWLGSMKSPGATPPDQPEDRVGLFQIGLSLCKDHVRDSDRCEPLPDAARVSNYFEVKFKAGG